MGKINLEDMMNKEIQSIKKRLSTQLEHKYRWIKNLNHAYDDEKEIKKRAGRI